MRFFIDLRRGLLAATSLAMLQVAGPAHAQYAPYPQTSQPYAQAAQNPYAALPQPTASQPYGAPSAAAPSMQQPAPTAPYQQYAAAQQQAAQQIAQRQAGVVAQQAARQYDAASQYVAARTAEANYPSGYPVGYSAVNQPAPSASAYPQTPTPAYGSIYGTPRTAMAYQTPASDTPSNLPLTPPAEVVPPGASSPMMHQHSGMPQPVPAPENAYPQADGYPAAGGYESYPSGYGAGGCATGDCNAPYGACDYSPYGCEQPGAMDRLLCRNSCNYWFGGVYGLLMERDSADVYNLAFESASVPGNGYPAAYDVVMTTDDVDPGFQAGVEFRLGRTFGCAPIDPCGCAPCGPRWGLEGVYWTIFEADETAVFSPSLRTYSMMPMPGLEYDGGNGYQPINSYWDYAPPANTGNAYSVTEVRARSSFEAQNVEINLLRLNICGGGCGTGAAMYNVGCDGGACGTGYGCGGPLSRFACTGVCGVRFLDIDDAFMYGVDYTGPVSGALNYWSTANNRLIGGQLGCNGMYRVGCKWGIHMNTLVGVYGNDIDTHQYIVTDGGPIRYISTAEAFDANADKTDVSMVGEVRLGLSYQATCHCRIYGGWRALGVTGLALATSQRPDQWLNAAQGASYVNSGDSLILHGLQTGVEWNY